MQTDAIRSHNSKFAGRVTFIRRGPSDAAMRHNTTNPVNLYSPLVDYTAGSIHKWHSGPAFKGLQFIKQESSTHESTQARADCLKSAIPNMFKHYFRSQQACPFPAQESHSRRLPCFCSS
jgi:hypothetical protein